MKKINADIVQHSINQRGDEIITFNLCYGRIIHPELIRTRTASHSVKSSRAIPLKKLRKEVKENPYVPVHFGTNQKGMQAGKETFRSKYLGERVWKLSARFACFFHWLMEKANIHKENTNRILEPYSWTEETMTIEKQDLESLAKLRIHPDAQPDIQKIVEEMVYVAKHSVPVQLNENEWHVPYVIRQRNENTSSMVYFDNDGKQLNVKQALICSASRCARSSYANHDKTSTTLENDENLAKSLVEDEHWSPFEHQVRNVNEETDQGKYLSNFRNFTQLRKIIEKENFLFGE